MKYDAKCNREAFVTNKLLIFDSHFSLWRPMFRKHKKKDEQTGICKEECQQIPI